MARYNLVFEIIKIFKSEELANDALKEIMRDIKRVKDKYTLDVWGTVDRVYECRRDCKPMPERVWLAA